MDGRVICAAFGAFLFIVIFYLIFSGGDDDADAIPAAVIPPKKNICKQTKQPFDEHYLVENNLSQLRLNDNYTDVELHGQPNGTSVRAHKVILASHSQYFDTKLWTWKSEPHQNGHLNFESIEHKTLMIVLNFMYSNTLPDDLFQQTDDYEPLLRAATEFQMDSLKCEIAKRLSPRINIHNAGTLMALATETNTTFLMIVAANYLLDQYQLVSQTNEWHAVIRAHKNILANAIEFHAKLPENTDCNIECVPATLQSPAVFTRLRQFLLTDRFADAEIHVTAKKNGSAGGGSGDSKLFRVNRAILTGQSAAFRQAFGDGQRIELDGIEIDVLEEFLIYMYSGWPTKKMNKMPGGLLYLSAVYGMKGLQTACENILIEQLNVENAAEIVVVADHANSKRLFSIALNFIIENRRLVVKTNAWSDLNRSHPEILTKNFTIF